MALLGALATPVHALAAEIPKQMRGTWCANSSPYQRVSRAPCEDPDGFVMEVTAKGFYVTDSPCTAIQVTKRGPVTQWGPSYRIKFKCTGEERKTLITEQHWQIEKDYLLVGLVKKGAP
jgi:hypothetical protein